MAIQVAPSTPGGPTPTGSLTISANGQTLPGTLSAGKAQVTAYPGWLPVGASSLAVNYAGDSNYNAASTTVPVTVGKAVMTMSILPNPASVTTAQNLDVIVTFTGAVSLVTPTGHVELTSGSFDSGPLVLKYPTHISVPAGALPAGTDTLTVSYSGDSNYVPLSNTHSVVITTPPPPPPTYTVTGTAVVISVPGATSGNTSTVTVTPAGGFTGSVVLAASLTSGPTGAVHLPQLSFGATSPVSVTSAGAATATLTVTTTAPTTGALIYPVHPQSRWYPLGETALACVVLFGFRARRQSWRIFLGMLLLMVAFSSAVTACGGGGGGTTSTPPPTPTPGTTAGTYVVAITATSGSTTAATTVNVVVQ